MTALEKYGFQDAHGHPLENCVDYHDLIRAFRLAVEAVSVLEGCCPVSLLPGNYRADVLDIARAVLQPSEADCMETPI